jgi:hypothetical protein
VSARCICHMAGSRSDPMWPPGCTCCYRADHEPCAWHLGSCPPTFGADMHSAFQNPYEGFSTSMQVLVLSVRQCEDLIRHIVQVIVVVSSSSSFHVQRLAAEFIWPVIFDPYRSQSMRYVTLDQMPCSNGESVFNHILQSCGPLRVPTACKI